MFLPMVDQANRFLEPHTLITADAGYFSDTNVQALHDRGVAALIADTMMRQRDQRFRDPNLACRFGATKHRLKTVLRVQTVPNANVNQTVSEVVKSRFI